MNKYVKNNGLKNREFGSLEEEKGFLLHWQTTVADTRIHGTTKQQVPVSQTSSCQAGTTGVHAAGSDHPQHRRLRELVRTSMRQPPQWQQRESRNHPSTFNPNNVLVVAW
jgi:hypothetical protein